MSKYFPAALGIAAILIASTALAKERRALESPLPSSHFVNHNDSQMLLKIDKAKDGISPLKIYYQSPSENMNSLVKRGNLFFDGSIRWDTRAVNGNARIYKWGC